MITASHNPYQDNGIKIFSAGHKLSPSQETSIERSIDSISLVSEMFFGKKKILEDDPIDIYRNLFTKLYVNTGLKIGLDLANGATCRTAKGIFGRFSKQLFYIGDEPDGKNINDGVGSTHPEALVELVGKNSLDVGFAFDGDGDRVIAVGKDGRIFDGDILIYVIACYLKAIGLLEKNTVVLTKMSNLGIIKALERKGIDVVSTDVGDKYVLEEMESSGYLLGGENSGHIINRLLLDTGDGVLNAAFILKIIHETGKSLEEMSADVVLFPSKMYNLRDIDRNLVDHPAIRSLIGELQSELGEDGKILVRASGTEPVIRIAVTAETEEAVDKIIGLVKDEFERISL